MSLDVETHREKSEELEDLENPVAEEGLDLGHPEVSGRVASDIQVDVHNEEDQLVAGHTVWER